LNESQKCFLDSSHPFLPETKAGDRMRRRTFEEYPVIIKSNGTAHKGDSFTDTVASKMISLTRILKIKTKQIY
jgi:hypothetical protein